MPILDTNVIIRYITQDSLELSSRARAILEPVDAGTLSVHLPEGVIVECVQVLESKRLYALLRETIQRHLANLIRMRGIAVRNKRLYFRALDLYIKHAHLDFVDALCVAYAEREAQPTVLTFDRGFDRVPGVTRRGQ